MKKFFFLFTLLGLLPVCFGQSTYLLGSLPAVNFNKKLEKDWSLNLKVEARQMYVEGDFQGNSSRGFNYQLTDFTFVGSKKVGFYGRCGVGYLIRFREDERVHRINQQYNFTKQYRRVRLSHRILTDQTFFKNNTPDFRVRYRLSALKPLNGEIVDDNEWYVKVNHEYVNNWQQSQFDLEIRLIPMFGYAVNKKNKLEIGVDYRWNSIVTEPEHRFWLALNWYLEL